MLATLLLVASPFEWALANVHVLGWPTLLVIVWRASKVFEKFNTQVTKTVGQIDTMATNHFPHMEVSLAKQDALLENIDKNIGRLADKI